MVKNNDIFLGSGASITKIPELDIYIPIDTAGSDLTTVDTTQIHNEFFTDFRLVNDLYIGCLLNVYDNAHAKKTTHRITGNTHNSITFTPAIASLLADDYLVIDSYGAPTPAPATGTTARLLADTWLGIVETATFPTTEVEMKQMNLALGGSRNFTYQYKGIETPTGGSLDLVANHASWLYYFLGKCTGVSFAGTHATTTPTDFRDPSTANDIYLNTTAVTETGPIFFRSVASVMTPYINKATESVSELRQVENSPSMSGGSISNSIEYTFAEQNGDLLPSFALEQVLSKLVEPSASTNIYRTETAETNESFNFVKIARGCRVNTLSMSANENEEVKINLDISTRNVHSLDNDESYEARRGVTDETTFFNFSSVGEFREPFFFSDGTFKVFNQSFLKINSLTINMNNNLQERRFLGVGNKSIQEAIPAQRTYEITFTGHVTDDLLYRELLNSTENTTQTMEIIFEKANGEKITLKFSDYFVTANNFPIPDDKGPIVVEATVMPRNLSECKVLTHWMLQG